MVAAFDCGDEPYECEVANWICKWIWDKPSLIPQTVIGVDEDTGDLVGYGTWKHVERFDTEPVETHVEIYWFGIDSRYKGARTDDGEKLADLIYATLEADALANERTTEDMPFTLSCEINNQRARTYWESHGYRLVGPPYMEVEKERYYRMVR